MKIIKPSVEVFFHYPHRPHTEVEDGHTYTWDGMEGDPISQVEFLEQVGRLCYKSESNIAPGSASKFVSKLKELGHWAMLEHCVASVKFVCDRGISHEIVRHRIASFAQISTRYCNYSKDKFGGEISVICPDQLLGNAYWQGACLEAEKAYMRLTASGVSPQIARSVLPTCLATELYMTANLREWATVFSLRTSSKAHPQIVEVMDMALAIFAKEMPEIFGADHKTNH